jgi:DNA-directed RNA polymerase specialized sigma24 family protein
VQGELSKLAPAADRGTSRGGDRLFAFPYDELHQVASRELRRNASAPLSPTTLLHETFLGFSLREFEIIALPEELPADRQSDIEIERLREALDTLRSIDGRLAECVDLKFFCGFSPVEIAQLWDVSERTVHRDWDKARLILSRLVGGADLDTWGIS